MSIKEKVKTLDELRDLYSQRFQEWLRSGSGSRPNLDEKWIPLEVVKERVLKLRDYIQSIPPEKLTPEITVIALRIDLVFGDICSVEV